MFRKVFIMTKKTIYDYVPDKDKERYCKDCMDCVCTRSCVIYRKAEADYDKNGDNKNV